MTNDTILNKKIFYFRSYMETGGTKRNKRSNVSIEMKFSVTEME